MNALFVTGTDTGVGKTWVALRLLHALRGERCRAAGFKPVECGSRDDGRALHAATADPQTTLDEVNPLSIAEPVAPLSAPGAPPIDFSFLGQCLDRLSSRHDYVIVEGAGGWLVPIDAERRFADLAMEWKLPVVLVAANRLGVLNHTLLTVEAIRSRGCECRQVILNDLPGVPGEDCSRESNYDALVAVLPGIPLVRTRDLDWGDLARGLFRP